VRGVFLDLASVDNGDLDRSSLKACLARWDWHGYTPAAEVHARIQGADVVVSNKCTLDRRALSAAGLKLVAVAATGTNNVDLEAARACGVTVCNIRDYCSESVAQHAITLLLNLLTGQPWYWQRVRQGEWSASRQFALHDRPIREARGLALGVIGYGSLGQAVADKARALGMQVLVAERRGHAPRPGRLAFEQVLQQADAISLHCPLTEDTRDLLGRAELHAMKPTALLINTARGGIVNDLAASLRAGEIAGAAVDTLDIEPPPPGHPLLAADIPNLLVTPHNAWASRRARQAALDQLADVIRAFLAGMPINVMTG
jgi:glycerate dehydrogenase